MPSLLSAAPSAILALILWGVSGWLIACRVFPGSPLAWGLAPTLGWAIQNTIALTLSLAVGYPTAMSLASVVVIAVATTTIPRDKIEEERSSLSPWIALAAALLALLPAVALLPKAVDGGIQMAGPIFDHSKVALIDEIVRGGVPPGNPFFQDSDGAGDISYYYLWQFGAAQLARLSGAGGWEADIASSWFTAFASLLLIGALAFHLCRHASAAWLAVGFSLIGSLRPPLIWLFGRPALDPVLKPATGLAGWLFQVSWSPHHVMAAGCVAIAVLLMIRLAMRPSIVLAALLALTAAAGFQSSLWVGGITFTLCAFGTAPVLLMSMEMKNRREFVAGCVGAAAGAVCLSLPLIIRQAGLAADHSGGFPVTIGAFPVFGPAIPAGLRRIGDIPAYWLILLTLELPVAFILGGISFWRMLRREAALETKMMIRAFAVVTLISLCGGWLLLSTIGYNNDLGWRAVLPAVILLNIAAGVIAAEWLRRPVSGTLAALAILSILALPDTANIIVGNSVGSSRSRSAVFADSPEMWFAVRRHAAKNDRVANNPLFLEKVTPWPVNISWALLADRRSCFAGNELVMTFSPLPPERRSQISDQFIRVFAGTGTSQDIADLAGRYHCRVVVVTVEDGAWNHDPFADSPLYRLAELKPGKWRIYAATQQTQ
jgi:hypothetical protein